MNVSSYRINFEMNGQSHGCTVAKIEIEYFKPPVFYRVGAKSGHRDLTCQNGEWVVICGPPLRPELLKVLGAAIEKALEERD